jgi:hypothetical protein
MPTKIIAGRTYTADSVTFYFTDKSNVEHYIGRVAVIGDHLLIPGAERMTITKSGGRYGTVVVKVKET